MTKTTTKYSDLLADWLVSLGYTHCFFVAGGNIMHLLESCSHRFTCIAVVHEVAAGIAAEYFNELHIPAPGDSRSQAGRKAFALVTAGPGLTNIVTAIAGAFLESRELLVIGGQVKVSDLSRSTPGQSKVRQRGIQEIDGIAITQPITERSLLMEKVVDQPAFARMIRSGEHGRKAPVFLEIPLDIQGSQVDAATLNASVPAFTPTIQPIPAEIIASIISRLQSAKRPVILLGAGIDRATTAAIYDQLAGLNIPIMVTWNAIDRIAADHPLYFGRPNTWGMRYSNILLQQADLLLALGTRLSLQQSGFNWQQFTPVGEIIQVDCDPAELSKGHPRVATPICGDANQILRALTTANLGDHEAWLAFCREVKAALPLVEPVNNTGPSYLSPYIFVEKLSDLATEDDVVIPCSSGSAYTVMMQAFAQKRGQLVVNNKGLAAMGYGLSGAIGAAIAASPRRTILTEGDGGFIQNLQELGTVAVNQLNLKIFIFDDNGYASIRMTQKNYFGGRYVGCDTSTGLGIPVWSKLFEAYGIPMQELRPGFEQIPSSLWLSTPPARSAFSSKSIPNRLTSPKSAAASPPPAPWNPIPSTL